MAAAAFVLKILYIIQIVYVVLGIGTLVVLRVDQSLVTFKMENLYNIRAFAIMLPVFN